MTRLFRKAQNHVRACQPNYLAGAIALGTLGLLLWNFEPQPVSATLGASRLSQPGPAPGGAAPAAAAGQAASVEQAKPSGGVKGKLALMMKLALLQEGCNRLEKVPHYTATFFKQERLEGGDLPEGQTMFMKLRHEPFSVYMKWLDGDVGREVLYVDGAHNGRMLVKKGGQVGKMLPSLKLDPNGTLAMSESRHPVTEAGLLKLAKMIADYCRRDVGLSEGVSCHLIGEERVNDRACYCFLTEYASKEVEPDYRKSLVYVDTELSLPIHVKNYGWPDAEGQESIDDATLIEVYSFADLRLDQRLADNAFDHTNKEYTFKR